MSIDFMRSSQDIINASKDLDSNSSIETLLKYFDKLVFVVIIMFDHFVLYSSENEADGEINGTNDRDSDKNIGSSCTDDVNSND